MSAPDHAESEPKNFLAPHGAFSNRGSVVKTEMLPRPGHGSLRGQPELPQHLVRSGSTGIARSTTGLRVITCPRPRPRNCLHPRLAGDTLILNAYR